ncbi:MAG: LuxR family transcriptional regulator [Leptolyngbya sp. PLA1]|nr:LuxR family transcriptional regulator [Leptolyngbya sp. PLA1]
MNNSTILECVGAEALLSALRDDLSSPLAVIDVGGNVVFANRVASASLAGPAADIAGAALGSLVGPAKAAECVSFIAEAITHQRVVVYLSVVKGHLFFVTLRPAGPQTGLVVASATAGSLVAEQPWMKPAGPVRTTRNNDMGALGVLTERELELLHHIGMAKTSDEAAQVMHRSTRTIEWHRASLGAKLGCDNRVQLARIANRTGITAIEVARLLEIHRAAKRASGRGDHTSTYDDGCGTVATTTDAAGSAAGR